MRINELQGDRMMEVRLISRGYTSNERKLLDTAIKEGKVTRVKGEKQGIRWGFN